MHQVRVTPEPAPTCVLGPSSESTPRPLEDYARSPNRYTCMCKLVHPYHARRLFYPMHRMCVTHCTRHTMAGGIRFTDPLTCLVSTAVWTWDASVRGGGSSPDHFPMALNISVRLGLCWRWRRASGCRGGEVEAGWCMSSDHQCTGGCVCCLHCQQGCALQAVHMTTCDYVHVTTCD